MTMRDPIDDQVRGVLADTLGLSADRVAAFTDDTPLFGADRIGILIEDDEVDGDMLETFGSLADFVRRKAIVA
jgi:acyl carrier protein